MKNILVIDDDSDLLHMIELRLIQEGYRVSLADNGYEGLQKTLGEQPDAVILDVMMPAMDGWEVCERIREHSNVPIIMLTAKTADTDVIKGLNVGADEYLTKPFRLSTLSARIEALLRRKAWEEAAVVGDLDTLKHNIISALSQELRTPVALILNALELSVNEAFNEDAEARNKFVVDALRNAEKLRWLIEDLLLLVRIDEGLEIIVRPSSIHALLQQIVNRSETTLNQRSIHAQVLFNADPLVLADQVLLRQALYHLFSNCLHHSPEGAMITVHGEAGQDGRFRIDFHDQGPGIDAIYQDQIFDRFFQVPARQAWKRNGLGIGLFLAREIARAHGGDVTVLSTPGEGATFRLLIPIGTGAV